MERDSPLDGEITQREGEGLHQQTDLHSFLSIRDKNKNSPFRNRARFHFLGYGNT